MTWRLPWTHFSIWSNGSLIWDAARPVPNQPMTMLKQVRSGKHKLMPQKGILRTMCYTQASWMEPNDDTNNIDVYDGQVINPASIEEAHKLLGEQQVQSIQPVYVLKEKRASKWHPLPTRGSFMGFTMACTCTVILQRDVRSPVVFGSSR
jgi:hypothetical protein